MAKSKLHEFDQIFHKLTKQLDCHLSSVHRLRIDTFKIYDTFVELSDCMVLSLFNSQDID